MPEWCEARLGRKYVVMMGLRGGTKFGP
jgi:hypothetical protein